MYGTNSEVRPKANNKKKYRAFHNVLGITKIDYRKTVGHVFTKPVQIEGTTQKIFSQ